MSWLLLSWISEQLLAEGFSASQCIGLNKHDAPPIVTGSSHHTSWIMVCYLREGFWVTVCKCWKYEGIGGHLRNYENWDHLANQFLSLINFHKQLQNWKLYVEFEFSIELKFSLDLLHCPVTVITMFETLRHSWFSAWPRRSAQITSWAVSRISPTKY